MSYIIHYLKSYLKKSQSSQFESSPNIQKGVVVSMTTTPFRIKKMWPTLNSILLQSKKPEKIYLWIPKSFKRFPNDKILHLPHFIKSNPAIEVNYIETDLGPATKLLPCLQLFANQDTKIIVLDDDLIYQKHLISNLLKHEQLDPFAAVGVAGTVVFGTKRKEYRATNKITLVDVLLGHQGYLVKPQFFPKAVFEYPNNLPEAFFEDDVWFSGHLERMGIRRMLIPAKRSLRNIITRQNETLALCRNENKGKGNFMCVFNYFRNTHGDQKMY
jgi:hypothetical protein